jgi:hypothetical protein
MAKRSSINEIVPLKHYFSVLELGLPDATLVFDNPDLGESFGGIFDRLNLDVGDNSDYLQYVRQSSMVFEDIVDGQVTSKTVAVFLARNAEGTIFSLPIAAIFAKNFKDASMVQGDIFTFRRTTDVTKKKGRGIGNIMETYEIKVLVRHR